MGIIAHNPDLKYILDAEDKMPVGNLREDIAAWPPAKIRHELLMT